MSANLKREYRPVQWTIKSCFFLVAGEEVPFARWSRILPFTTTASFEQVRASSKASSSSGSFTLNRGHAFVTEALQIRKDLLNPALLLFSRGPDFLQRACMPTLNSGRSLLRSLLFRRFLLVVSGRSLCFFAVWAEPESIRCEEKDRN